MSFSIIIPIYNEEKNIEKLFKEIVLTLSKFNTEYEIVLISKKVTIRHKSVANAMYLNPSPYLMMVNVFELIILFFIFINFYFSSL